MRRLLGLLDCRRITPRSAARHFRNDRMGLSGCLSEPPLNFSFRKLVLTSPYNGLLGTWPRRRPFSRRHGWIDAERKRAGTSGGSTGRRNFRVMLTAFNLLARRDPQHQIASMTSVWTSSESVEQLQTTSRSKANLQKRALDPTFSSDGSCHSSNFHGELAHLLGLIRARSF